MAKSIMVQGTCSNAGKSFLVAGLCRIFSRAGYRVCPFKAQNMALNSYILPNGLELGRGQVMQAEAAGAKLDVRMNPILLKPTSDKGSEVIINGRSFGNMPAAEYYRRKNEFRSTVKKSYEELEAQNDIMVIEGAGSPAEINLMEDDLVNMGMAAMVDSPVLLAGDIDRGGVFASLAGTVFLLPPADRARIKGFIINKFRGDVSLLKPGLDMLYDLIKIPVVGVVPYMNVDIDDEDSLSDCFENRNQLSGNSVDIAVIKLPRISDFTDFNALDAVKGLNIRYISSVRELGEPDMLVIPDTKNPMGDLLWMRSSGLEAAVKKLVASGKPVFGISGGMEMLGQSLEDPDNIERGGSLKGFGLLPHRTLYRKDEIQRSESGSLGEVGGLFKDLSGKTFEGYEQHRGLVVKDGGDDSFSPDEKIINRGNVYGTYIHGLFDRREVAETVAGTLLKQAGCDSTDLEVFDRDVYKEGEYDKLADYLSKALDMEYIYEIMGLK